MLLSLEDDVCAQPGLDLRRAAAQRRAELEVRIMRQQQDSIARQLACDQASLDKRRSVLIATQEQSTPADVSKQIAEKLHLSPRTIESHRANILKKMNSANTFDLMKKLIQINSILVSSK